MSTQDGEGKEIPLVTGLRDRALIGIMPYTFARVGAVLQMNVSDYFTQGRRRRVRLHEKGGTEREAQCHHNLEIYLDEYIAAAGIMDDKDGPQFRTTGITAYLKNGGTCERAQAMVAHSSARTTQLHDRRDEEVSLDESEKVGI